jgi:hypothetical protein
MRRFGLEKAIRAGAADVKIRAWVTQYLARRGSGRLQRYGISIRCRSSTRLTGGTAPTKPLVDFSPADPRGLVEVR